MTQSVTILLNYEDDFMKTLVGSAHHELVIDARYVMTSFFLLSSSFLAPLISSLFILLAKGNCLISSVESFPATGTQKAATTAFDRAQRAI